MSDFRMMHTPQGEQLLAQVHAGVPMQLTRVVLGNGIWTAAEQSSHDLTGLKAQRMSLAITGVTQSGDEAEVTAMLDNSALDAGFSCTEMGVYARPVIGEGSGEELLYMVGYLEPAKSSFVHSRNGTPMLIPVTVTIVVAGSGGVTIAFKNDFYYVTKSDLTKHDSDPNAHGVLMDSVRAHAPLVIVAGSADIWEGESTQLLIQDWHTYEWASEVKVRITDAGGADRTALWTVTPNLTTGRIDLTAPQVDADQTYGVAVQVWEHGLVRSKWTQPLTINVGDVPINRPAITAPAAGATGVGETPTITTGAFSADADQTHADTQMQIATDTGFAAIVRDTGSLGPVTAYEVPPGILTTGHVYYVRARHKGSDGNWSPWSPVSSFFTAASFIYVDRPVNTSPVAGAGEIGETPTLAASAYSTNGTGNHAHTRFQVDVAGGDFSAPVHDSGLLDAVTDYAVPAGVLDVDTQYIWRVQYTDDSAGPVASEWSSPTAFTTAAIFGVPWETWDEVAESTLAHPDCFVAKFENPNSGGNELGQGGEGLTDADRTIIQWGNFPGVSGGFRTAPRQAGYSHPIGVGSYCVMSVPAKVIEHLVGNPGMRWSVIAKVKDVKMTNSHIFSWGKSVQQPYAAIGLTSNTNTLWLNYGADKVSTPIPETGTIYLAWWSDGIELRCGWSTVRPTKWSDFHADKRTVATKVSAYSPVSRRLLPSDLVGCKANNYNTSHAAMNGFYPDSYSYATSIGLGYLVIARECLIDNNA